MRLSLSVSRLGLWALDILDLHPFILPATGTPDTKFFGSHCLAFRSPSSSYALLYLVRLLCFRSRADYRSLCEFMSYFHRVFTAFTVKVNATAAIAVRYECLRFSACVYVASNSVPSYSFSGREERMDSRYHIMLDHTARR